MAQKMKMTARELFEACRQNETPLEVMNISGSAADNAAATIEDWGGKFVQGHFTDEFIQIWFGTVQGLLCEYDCNPGARAWFEAAGVSY